MNKDKEEKECKTKWNVYNEITKEEYEFDDRINNDSEYSVYFSNIGWVLGRSHESELAVIIKDKHGSDRFNRLTAEKQRSFLKLSYSINSQYEPIYFNMNSGRHEKDKVIHGKFKFTESGWNRILTSLITKPSSTSSTSSPINDCHHNDILKWLKEDCYGQKKDEWQHAKNCKNYGQIRNDCNDYIQWFSDSVPNIFEIYNKTFIDKYKKLKEYIYYDLNDIDFDYDEDIKQIQHKLFIKNQSQNADVIAPIICEIEEFLNAVHPPLINNIEKNKFYQLSEDKKDDIRWRELFNININKNESQKYFILPMTSYIVVTLLFGAENNEITKFIRKYIDTLNAPQYRHKYGSYNKTQCDHPHYIYYLDIEKEELLHLNKIGKNGKNRRIIYNPKFNDNIYKYCNDKNVDLRKKRQHKQSQTMSNNQYDPYLVNDDNRNHNRYCSRKNSNNYHQRYNHYNHSTNHYQSRYAHNYSHHNNWNASNDEYDHNTKYPSKSYRKHNEDILIDPDLLNSTKINQRKRRFEIEKNDNTDNHNNNNSDGQPPAKKRKF